MAKAVNKISDEAVKNATGRDWNAWIEIIDDLGGDKMSHKEIARMLYDKNYIKSGWWCQSVTVGYEFAKGRRIKGETADAGFEVGVSKTFDVAAKKAWTILTSTQGVRIWLGNVKNFKAQKGAKFETSDKISGEIRTLAPGEKLRMQYQPEEGKDPTTLQIYLFPNGNKTSVRFHQEKLADADEREKMRKHWQKVLSELEKIL